MRSKSTEYIECNICKSDNTATFLKGVTSWEHSGVFTLVKCKKCGLVYVNPRPIQSKIGAYYPADSYWGDDVTKENSKDPSFVRQKSYRYLYKHILKRKHKGAVLDIGAGTGMFLSYFKELGFKTDGVEYSHAASIYSAKTFGVKLRIGDFLQKKFIKNTYDVVTLNNSLEHLYDPLKSLVELNKVMKKGGIIVVTVPNIESLGYKIFKGDWYALQPPRHLYHFSEHTLTGMLQQAGFKHIECKRGYFQHNYSTIFESIRISRSEKFKKLPKGGVVQKETGKTSSLKSGLQKAAAKSISFVLAYAGTLMHRSEAITVIASK